MIIDDIQFEMNNGRKALLRSPKYEDINGMLEYLFTSASETEFLMRYPEECSKYTSDSEKALFDRINASSNEVMLVCLVDGKVAGNCHLSIYTGLKTRHRATVAIALLSEFWGQGIGTRMFNELIRIAKENEDVMQIELQLIEGNNRARHLYEKLGFRITGVHPNAIRLKDGRLLNEYTMIKEIKR